VVVAGGVAYVTLANGAHVPVSAEACSTYAVQQTPAGLALVDSQVNKLPSCGMPGPAKRY
jgi:hypothetical protein